VEIDDDLVSVADGQLDRVGPPRFAGWNLRRALSVEGDLEGPVADADRAPSDPNRLVPEAIAQLCPNAAAADARGHRHADGDIVNGRLVVLTAEVRHGLGPRRLPAHAVVGLVRAHAGLSFSALGAPTRRTRSPPIWYGVPVHRGTVYQMGQDGVMAKTSRSSGARSAGLTRDRIVDATIDLLDAEGESGLTFRSLALKLKTGHGAIQWHVATKGELLAAATVTVLARALTPPTPGTPPRLAVHAVALGVFTAIEAHPWLGPQLFTVPWQPAMVRLWEQIGRPVEEMGVPEDSLFTAVSTLVSYIVGVGSRNAVNTHSLAAQDKRDDFLSAVAARWESLDPIEHSFVRRMAGQLRAHDDRVEFLAGIDIILSGLVASH
jgi:AcrR family transcriptional regulator